MLVVGGVVVIAAVGVTLGLTLGRGGPGGSSPQPVTSPRISIGLSGCGTGWTKPAAGQQDFLLVNTDLRNGDAQLIDPASGAVYADVEPLGSGASAHLRIVLGHGSYAFRCVMEDDNAITGPTVTIGGTLRTPVAPVLPVTRNDLVPVARAYETYVNNALPGLIGLTRTLSADIGRGDLAAARRDWLPAHLAYERLGAAYGAFDTADSVINGRPDGLPDGLRDPGFTGFHRLEYGLWHGESAASLGPVADALVTAETDLQTAFPQAQIDPLDIAIRAHEITENTLQFTLTGHDDLGSGSELATARANLDGTRTVLGLLRPLLRNRYPTLPALDALITTTDRDLASFQHPDATYPAMADLSVPDRERVDSDFSELSEQLAPIASICEPRRTQ
ncbi:EfeM/EfeO family lipoprotein [Frankia sp. AgB1.9]|uniref:EfeM/EfeO family lipoprotein n=1 Tax=unclassified Frankia TaxID=2632575 RepID=UPI001931D925|nr:MULTISPECIES: EfeM/EfeO family lipoprotein [unclassified Frankia]MBL7488675.1 EfeM/EfeO family lipoprotein [Frankia sp. AgW1.1]MBL7551795.1 EfeM/EfeO family lipoprotein [Frankia sp. AgB1.9]MBL7621116.1 EfeM/EfeO family lipoprotein [Frankia sp. AgB1.8]